MELLLLKVHWEIILSFLAETIFILSFHDYTNRKLVIFSHKKSLNDTQTVSIHLSEFHAIIYHAYYIISHSHSTVHI